MKLSGLYLSISLLLLVACDPPQQPAEEFTGSWKQPTAEVMRALAVSGIDGCGEFYQKESTISPKTFAVVCTSDQLHWTAYMVWPAINKVLGPDDMFLVKLGGPPYAINRKGKRVDFQKID